MNMFDAEHRRIPSNTEVSYWSCIRRTGISHSDGGGIINLGHLCSIGYSFKTTVTIWLYLFDYPA